METTVTMVIVPDHQRVRMILAYLGIEENVLRIRTIHDVLRFIVKIVPIVNEVGTGDPPYLRTAGQVPLDTRFATGFTFDDDVAEFHPLRRNVLVPGRGEGPAVGTMEAVDPEDPVQLFVGIGQ